MSKETESMTSPMYFADDGNWGGAGNIAIIDVESWDTHQIDYIDGVSDWARPDFARWADKNVHEFEADSSNEYECVVCERGISEVVS